MSLETWKKEFYKVPANTDMSELEAVEHSLLKWRGLQKTYLNKHGLEKDFKYIEDCRGDNLTINVDTCALCFKFYSRGDASADGCRECPLVKAGFTNCESSRTTPAYIKWIDTGDPKQMIQELRTTLRLVK